jgi:hypothetical protein
MNPVARVILLTVLVATGLVCFYKVFMFGALSVAPGSSQQEYKDLANLYLLGGIASIGLGIAALFLGGRRKPPRAD